MESTKRTIIVHTFVGDRTIEIPVKNDTTAEEVCVLVAKELKISPAARLLFALKLHGKGIFFHPGFKFSELLSNECDFRLRFKIPSLKHLQRLDVNAFSYYFHQACHDVRNSKIPDLKYANYKGELLGLSVVDMYREMIEKNRKKDAVLKEYKRFVPTELFKKQLLFMNHFFKAPIQKSLQRIQQTTLQVDALGVKECYLETFIKLVPAYLCEEYAALKLEGDFVLPVTIRVDPFHPEYPGILYKEDNQKDWTHLCTINHVVYINIGDQSRIEIQRYGGILVCFQFPSLSLIHSFISLVDGYYRLGVCWTVTSKVTRGLTPPSLLRLKNMKCHGPVGPKFAAKKLNKKCNYQRGSFILRESETHYDTYLLDVCCVEGAPPEIFTIEHKVQNGVDGFMLAADGVWYESVTALVVGYKDEGSRPWLNYCLPPSDLDEPEIPLLCRVPTKGDDKTCVNTEFTIKPKHDIIDHRSLLLGQEIKGKLNSSCSLDRGQWITEEGGKVDVAVRRLCKNDFSDEFFDVATSWARLKETSIVRLLGLAFRPTSLVLELVPMGSFDKYLQENRNIVKDADLVEAAAGLASAVWYLETKQVVHGNIRCRKLLVSKHDQFSMVVKLSDPGLPSYSDHDIHWLPPECYDNPASARSSVAADLWASGTTIWEIFAYGSPLRVPYDPLAVKKYYSSGGRLPAPTACPGSVLHIINECWHGDPDQRKQPQGLMRDLRQLTQAYSRAHMYSAVKPKDKRMLKAAEDSASIIYTESILSVDTMNFSLDSTTPSERTSFCMSDISNQDAWLLGNTLLGESQEPLLTTDQLTTMLHASRLDTSGQSEGETAFELDRECTVVLQGRIGQGFYGEVYRGTLERMDEFGVMESELVAVKKLKLGCLGDGLEDFERESSIMKKLKHPNIVRLVGIVHEPEIRLVMEFVPLGSLQCYLTTPRTKPLTHHELLKFALDVSTGMEYLGEQNIVHRDLATRNILVAAPDLVKISDFGLAQVMSSQSDYYIMQTSRELPLKWYALESLQNGRFSARSDVWSFGVAVWEMFSGGSEPCLPGCEDRDQSGLVAALERGIRLSRPPECPESVHSRLMAPCWQVPSNQRPTFSALCSRIIELNETLF